MINSYLRGIGFGVLLPVFLFAALCVLPDTSAAQSYHQTFKSFKVIPLKNGPNQIDLNEDGLKDIVFVAWRENFNAHSFEIITFYLQMKTIASSMDNWQLVPFFNAKGVSNMLSYTTDMGADCILSDIRILRPRSSKRTPVTIVIGIRELGESYADDAAVKFLVYESKINKEGLPGEPSFYFQHTKTIPIMKKYCDINEAFQKELGLGWHRIDHPEEWNR